MHDLTITAHRQAARLGCESLPRRRQEIAGPAPVWTDEASPQPAFRQGHRHAAGAQKAYFQRHHLCHAGPILRYGKKSSYRKEAVCVNPQMHLHQPEPPSAQELFHRCFEDAHAEPEVRTSAVQWQHALEEAEHELTTCPRDAQHLYHRRLNHRPWGGLIPASGAARLAAPTRRSGEPSRTNRSVKRTKIVDDPLPPRLEEVPTPTTPSSGGAELVLQATGESLERRGWLVWVGVALIGSVDGIIYALQHALRGKSLGP
jgi:hypothetical protein